MVALDHKKLKIKSESNGENLFEALTNGKFYTLPEQFQERSKFLIEPTQSINIGDTKMAKTLHLAKILTKKEKLNFIKFFVERKIKISWSYADMQESIQI